MCVCVCLISYHTVKRHGPRPDKVFTEAVAHCHLYHIILYSTFLLYYILLHYIMFKTLVNIFIRQKQWMMSTRPGSERRCTPE